MILMTDLKYGLAPAPEMSRYHFPNNSVSGEANKYVGCIDSSTVVEVSMILPYFPIL